MGPGNVHFKWGLDYGTKINKWGFPAGAAWETEVETVLVNPTCIVHDPSG